LSRKNAGIAFLGGIMEYLVQQHDERASLARRNTGCSSTVACVEGIQDTAVQQLVKKEYRI
jgi:hypothetical protein